MVFEALRGYLKASEGQAKTSPAVVADKMKEATTYPCNTRAKNQDLSDFHVGVVLDMDSVIGKIGWKCIELAISDFYAAYANCRTRLFLHPRDSQGDNVKASLAVLDLLQNVEVQAIIGPQTSTQAGLTIDFGNKAQVPLLSFSATSPSLSFRSPYFIQAAQNDSSQLQAITAILQSFQWKEVITIYENSELGIGMIPFLIDVFQEAQVRIPYKILLSPLATDDQIRVELYKLANMHYRVFIVHMSHTLGSRFFALAKELGMMSKGYVWIITDGIMNVIGSMDTSVISSMQGVLGVKPYIGRSPRLDNFTDRWRRNFHQDLNIYGLWAYDTVWTLAMAAERVGVMKSLSKIVRTRNNSATIKTSESGSELLEIISKTRFKGLSGEFYFVNGQLQVDTFQILNVIGNEAREVGFWTSDHGLSMELNWTNVQTYTASMTNLRGIIWPGDSVIVPNGWMISASGKKLKIGVPMKAGFDEFVRVDRDISTNQTTISGYSIDFFKSVMAALPYPIAYEFEPFTNADGSSAGSHYELIYQVHQQRYDAVVGDTTITANRSLCVDFSLPFAEGGVSMMVPIKHDDRESAWIFLKPLTKDLWLTSGAFFILTGLVVWVLEHRVNEDFRGPPSQHVGMILWFPLSTIVFAHRERIVSNLTRFVVIVWIFVILILNSSYTASLSSILTAEKLQRSVTVEELVKNGDYVGHQKGSFIPDLLKHMHFDESKLKPFTSHEDMDEALQRGSKNGGIAAFFDVVPYIKIFIAKYCNRYTMVGISKTEGFGMAFPRGSPLVADVSRAILKVQESDKMKELDRALFEIQTICSDLAKNANSNSLDLNSFRGLFFITGTVSGSALLVFVVIFLYKNQHILAATESGNTIWIKLKTMFKQFDGKDFSSYRFKKGDFDRDRSLEVGDIEASQSSRSVSQIRDREAPITIISTSICTGENHSPSQEIVLTNVVDATSDSVVLEEMDNVPTLSVE